ncbi:hypothetical protein AVEN_162045-1 [Araneus ventricosus]|uniref:Uncharacterized protein n=1 Tax=Araneus ventricosus TaxID=182803 RepID=A0A4Y2TJI4_ARAVE|nr:hypothetical protein AVEN_182358-1 [Araneus ventricosus]GBN99534.1 hypothetical protein AVEN_136514-1 [Araneus ventricosus]GBN99539.1 hypothetical protein AVEN_162045-1 [Araneus ventricosus]
MKHLHSPMNNTTCKLMDNTCISLACPTSDSHPMEKGSCNNGKDVKDYANTFNLRQLCFDNDCQSKSSDLLYHKEARKMGKWGPVDDHNKNKDDLMNCRKQSLELGTEHPKESTAPQTEDNNTQTDNEKLTSDLPQMEGLLPESYRDLRYEAPEASSSKGVSDPETARDDSFEIHKEAADNRCLGPDITFVPSGENSVEKKKLLPDQQFPTMKMRSNKKQNHMESKPVGNLETRWKVKPWLISNPLQKPKLCDPDSVSNSLHKLKVNRQLISSRGNEENESNTPIAIIDSSNISKRVVFLNQNCSDLSRNTFSKASSNKSAKSSGSVQKSAENQVSDSNQRFFFSRWRVMALIIVLIVVAIDWKSLLECLDKNR